MSGTWQGQLIMMLTMRQGQPMGTIVQIMVVALMGTPSLGVSMDLSSLFRPPTRPANPPLPSTVILAWDPFVQPVGPKKPLPPEAKPIDFFEEMFDDYLLSRIVFETNLYAQQKGKYAKTWYDLMVPEFKAFLGYAF